MTSVYRVGEFIDLCTGPHLPHTGLVKAFTLTKNSAIHTEEHEKPTARANL